MLLTAFLSGTPYLTCAEVAQREGLSREAVARLCRLQRIFPVRKVSDIWLIDPFYQIAATAGRHGRPRTEKPHTEKGWRGRPEGSKNKKSYPKGVKRPRRTSAQFK